MEVVGKDGPGGALGSRKRVRTCTLERSGLVLHLELDVTSITVKHKAQGIAIVKESLRTRGQTWIFESDECEILSVVPKAGPVLVVDATPQICGTPVDLVADPMIATESTLRVAPGQVDAFLPVQLVVRWMQAFVRSLDHHNIEDTL